MKYIKCWENLAVTLVFIKGDLTEVFQTYPSQLMGEEIKKTKRRGLLICSKLKKGLLQKLKGILCSVLGM